jgi:hypothetical protein
LRLSSLLLLSLPLFFLIVIRRDLLLFFAVAVIFPPTYQTPSKSAAKSSHVGFSTSINFTFNSRRECQRMKTFLTLHPRATSQSPQNPQA